MSAKIVYCTIASANYLSRIHVLERSLAQHQPNSELRILLCEHPNVCKQLAESTGRQFLSPADVCPNWLHMAFYYDITEFNTALKPFLLDCLLRAGYKAAIYFDPDIEIFGELNELEKLLQEHDLILTPHLCQPLAMDGFLPSIDSVVRAGQFNLGFIGIAESDESMRALRWWRDVCIEYCIFDGSHRFFVDQFWADMLPSFIQKFYCLRDPAYNMAYWNVFQRELRYEKNEWLTSTGRLRFFHFSGLSVHDLTKVSRHQNRVTAPVGSPLHSLLTQYLEKIHAAPSGEVAEIEYSFDSYLNGGRIKPQDRKKFLYLPKPERDEIFDPFAVPDTIRKIVMINTARLNEAAILRSYRRNRYVNHLRLLYKQYQVSIQARGFFAATRSALLFVIRTIRGRFISK